MTPVPPAAPLTSTRPLTELASGVDALYLSGHGQPRPEVIDALEDIRSLATRVNEPLPTIIDDVPLIVAPHGFGKYRYCIDHPHARIGVTTSRHIPPVRIQPRSEYLHGIGPTAAVPALTELAGQLCDDLTLSVNRVDLYADWQHWDLTTADKARFVGRADTARTYEQAGGLSGFDFGTRTSHTVVARIYDKTLDIDRKGAPTGGSRSGATATSPAPRPDELAGDRRRRHQDGPDPSRSLQPSDDARPLRPGQPGRRQGGRRHSWRTPASARSSRDRSRRCDFRPVLRRGQHL